MISIRPEVGMYAAFARLNYRPWYALAEFVDNALQSALTNLDALRDAAGSSYRLVVEIETNEDGIEVRDNAAGIKESEYARAFLPAAPPPDRSGLSEFGLGMKAAASWFARTWSVRTSALEEPVERAMIFDIPRIVATKCEQLAPTERAVPAADHYTTITLRDLQVRPRGRTIGKIRDHLSSIYRLFLRDGLLELYLNGEKLTYEPPTFLHAAYHATPTAAPVTWRKEIDLDLGDGHRVRGWAALLARASVTNAGFAVFRRKRLIQGSHGEGYRPESLFGKQNKFTYQRLVGEIEVEGFSVSHTKDGVQWDDWEEDILTWIKSSLDAEPLRLLDQAENYRARSSTNRDAVGAATQDTSQAIAQHLPPIIDDQLATLPDEQPLASDLRETADDKIRSARVEFNLEHAQRRWIVEVELVSDARVDAWYELAECLTDHVTNQVRIRVNMAHPFMLRFVSPDGDELIPFTRLAAGLAIAEITAREVGVRQAGTIRMNLNQILRAALSGPVQPGEAEIGDRE